jgi:drug/metabolite transporter (DMT)-like permease
LSTDPARRRALGLALAVTVLWSSSWIMVRWAIDDHGMTPILGAGLRYLLGSLVLAGIVATVPVERALVRGLGRREVGRLVALGLVFYALTQGSLTIAIAAQPAATTSLFLALTPLLVAIASQASLGEPPSRAQLVGALAIGAGAALYLSGDLGLTVVGLIASIVCLTSNVASSILGRAVNRTARLPPRVVTSVSMGVGAVVLVAMGWLAEGPPRLDTTGWFLVCWMALVNTALAFTWWNASLRHLAATESAAVNNLMLLEIAALAWLLLGEAPGLVQWLGMGLLTVGVFAAQVRSTEPRVAAT